MECKATFAESVLEHPDQPFVLQEDTSDEKNQQGTLQPCAYISWKLSDAEHLWVVWEKEVYTVQWTPLTWRQFLEGSKSKTPFEVWTDHKNLEALKIIPEIIPQTSEMGTIF